MASEFVKVAGLSELGERMRQLSEKVNKKICARATGKAAGIVKKLAQAKAPKHPVAIKEKGTIVPAGNLAANIVMKKVRSSSLTSQHIVTVRGKRKYGFARHTGIMNEFGTVKMAAQPFLRPSFEQAARGQNSSAVTAMKEELVKGIIRGEG